MVAVLIGCLLRFVVLGVEQFGSDCHIGVVVVVRSGGVETSEFHV